MSSDKVFFPEELYSGWISNSLVLTTTSLLFYHMTKLNSLEMDARIAGIFAVVLIVISIAYAITSIVPYYQRSSDFVKDPENQKNYPDIVYREKRNRIIYLVLGAVLATIQVGIAVVITKGSFIKKKLNFNLPS